MFARKEEGEQEVMDNDVPLAWQGPAACAWHHIIKFLPNPQHLDVLAFLFFPPSSSVGEASAKGETYPTKISATSKSPVGDRRATEQNLICFGTTCFLSCFPGLRLESAPDMERLKCAEVAMQILELHARTHELEAGERTRERSAAAQKKKRRSSCEL